MLTDDELQLVHLRAGLIDGDERVMAVVAELRRLRAEVTSLKEIPSGMRHEPCWQTGSKLLKERDEAQRLLTEARAEVERLRALNDTQARNLGVVMDERDAAIREADRLRHGVPIEGDYVCPDALRADEAEARARPVLTVVERDGLDFARTVMKGRQARALLAGMTGSTMGRTEHCIAAIDRLLSAPAPSPACDDPSHQTCDPAPAPSHVNLSEYQIADARVHPEYERGWNEAVAKIEADQRAAPSHQTCEGARRCKLRQGDDTRWAMVPADKCNVGRYVNLDDGTGWWLVERDPGEPSAKEVTPPAPDDPDARLRVEGWNNIDAEGFYVHPCPREEVGAVGDFRAFKGDGEINIVDCGTYEDGIGIAHTKSTRQALRIMEALAAAGTTPAPRVTAEQVEQWAEELARDVDASLVTVAIHVLRKAGITVTEETAP